MPTTRYVIPKGLVERLISQDQLLQKKFDPSQVFGTLTGSITAAQLRAQLASLFATFAAVNKLEIQLEQALVARTARIAEAQDLAERIKGYATAALGVDHPALDTVGLRRHGGKRTLTAEEELVRHARAKETMKLQGRLTKAEKKARTYRGDVKVTVTTKK
jgi:hypothetical protein